MKQMSGPAMVIASGWFSTKLFENAAINGALSSVGLFSLFLLVSVFGIAFGKSA